MEDLKKKVEALLFSSARRMNLEEIAKLCRQSPENIREVLLLLKKEYDEKEGSLMVVPEGDYWKLTTKQEYFNLVKSIVTQTELSKTLMETLAVIAFKYPIKQADLIKIRTNKAYDHLKELEELGYITRQKYGRTRLIKLSQKFFDYFSLPEDKLKEQFNDFEGLAEAISSKEDEIKKINAEQKKRAKEAGKKEVDLVDKDGNNVKLDVVDEPEESSDQEKEEVQTYNDDVGGLEVVDIPKEDQVEIRSEEKHIEVKKGEPEKSEEQKEEEIKIEHEKEEKVDEKVNEILGIDSSSDEKETNLDEGNVLEDDTEDKEENNKEEMSDVDKKIDNLINPKEEKPQHQHEVDKEKWGQEKEPLHDKPEDFVKEAFKEEDNNHKNNESEEKKEETLDNGLEENTEDYVEIKASAEESSDSEDETTEEELVEEEQEEVEETPAEEQESEEENKQE